MIKISCGTANHYKTLKSGAIRYQKSLVSDPLWRYTVETEDGRLFGRFFPGKPTLEQVWACTEDVLERLAGLNDRETLISNALEQAVPGLVAKLQGQGFDVYCPRGSRGGLASVAKRFDKVFDGISTQMDFIAEADLTLEEFVGLADCASGVLGPIERGKEWTVGHGLAETICRRRGRDPKAGAERHRSTGIRAPRHTSERPAKDHDDLAAMIAHFGPDNIPPGFTWSREGRLLYEIALALEAICRHSPGSEAALKGTQDLATLLQGHMFTEGTLRCRGRSQNDYFTYLWPLSMEIRRWLGSESTEGWAFKEGLIDACRRPAIIDGVTHAFFRLPVRWEFTRGLEETRTLRYLPWREVVEHTLFRALSLGCQVILDDVVRDTPLTGDNLLFTCCGLVATARRGHTFFGEAQGKRTATAVPKARGKRVGETEFVGVVRFPRLEVAPIAWHPDTAKLLGEAAVFINGNLAKTLNSLTLEFGRPLPMA